MYSIVQVDNFHIREQITPKGDGNLLIMLAILIASLLIREQITPKGDGNSLNFACFSDFI